MGRTILSVIAVLAIAAGAVAGPCADPTFAPGTTHGKFISDITICEIAALMDETCDDVANALRRFQHDSTDINANLKGKGMRLPTEAELAAVRNPATFSVNGKASASSSKPSPEKPKIRSKLWTKNFATREQRQTWFMENYVLKPGENIFSVAKKFGNAHWKSPQVIVWFNGLENPGKLGAGHGIMIPDTNHFYWLEYNVAPYGNRPLSDAVFWSGLSDSVQGVLLRMIEEGGHYKDGFIKSGQILIMMASASLSQKDVRGFDIKHDVVVCLKDNQAIHGFYLEVVEGDSICIAFIPDYCNNFSSYKIPAPPREIPSEVEEPQPPEDSIEWSEDPTPVDSTPDRGIEPPLDTTPIFNKNMGQLGGGRYFPLPYAADGHNFLWGRLSLFLPTEEGSSFAFGLNLGASGWNGYGPRPERFQYAGLRPFGGFVFDWLTGKSRFDIFLNYAVQLDWGWDGSYVSASKQYHSRQTTQLVNPSLAWVGTSAPDWSWWWGWWLDGGADLARIDSRTSHKLSDIGGSPLTKSRDPATEKSYACAGLYVFYWNISTKKTSLVLGTGVKSLHLWEDNRYEVEGDELLDINHWFQLGVGYKYTWNSIYLRQNGPSLVAYFNLSVLDIGKYKHNKQ